MIFEEATLEVEATKRPTLHLVLPWYFRLLHHCEISSVESVVISALKSKGLAYLNSNISEHITIHHKVATFLCPKLKPLRMYNSSSDKNEIIDAARDMLDKLIPKEQYDMDNDRAANNTRSRSDSTRRLNVSQAILMFEDDSIDILNDENDEIQRYINHHVTDMDGCELLEWCVADV